MRERDAMEAVFNESKMDDLILASEKITLFFSLSLNLWIKNEEALIPENLTHFLAYMHVESVEVLCAINYI